MYSNNNIKIIDDFFLNNMYAIVALILLAIFLIWSTKIVFARANLAKPLLIGEPDLEVMIVMVEDLGEVGGL
jgi:pyruvate-formate lyase